MENITRRDFLKKGLVAASLVGLPSISFASSRGAWPHLREWNYEETQKYARWIENIQNNKLNGPDKYKGAKINYILKNDEMNLLNDNKFLENGNSQASNSAIDSMYSMCDCGRFPMLMFTYYCMRRGLPAVITANSSKQVRSIPFSGDFNNFINANEDFCSRSFRTDPKYEKSGSVLVAIDRKFLLPGNIGYDVNGHGLLVGKVEYNGDVRFLDSHPDQSISYSKKIDSALDGNIKMNGVVYGGLRNFRLAKVVNGVAVPMTNEEMKNYGFSLEQTQISGRLSDYVREKLRLEKSKESPLEYLSKASHDWGEMMRGREEFLQQAWKEVLTNGAINFPNGSSIYNADGRWEVWSSPSSDCDRKQAYNGMIIRLKQIVEEFPSSSGINYDGFNSRKNLASRLIEEKEKRFSQEKVAYRHSSGKIVELSLLDVEKRLWNLSFDPNHPPELRWGAPNGSDERKDMRLIDIPINGIGSLNGLKAYEMEKGLRYFAIRQPGIQYIDSTNNPKEPPFGTIEETLKNF